MIQDRVSILAYRAAVGGVVFPLGRLEALPSLFDRLPPLVWACKAIACLGNVLVTYSGLLVAQLLAGSGA
jgi:hypothetical protein